jgi:hypothetical protein
MNAPFLLFAVLPILIIAVMGDWDKITATCCGIAAAIASIAVEKTIGQEFALHGFPLMGGLRAFLLFGFTEELLKYASLTTASCLTNKGRWAVQASIFCGVGFASIENFLYTSGFWHALGATESFSALSLLRFFMPFMMHVAAGALLASGYCIRGFRPIGGLFLATAYHGTYDAMLGTSSQAGITIAYLLILGGFVTSAFIYRNASGSKTEGS